MVEFFVRHSREGVIATRILRYGGSAELTVALKVTSAANRFRVRMRLPLEWFFARSRQRANQLRPGAQAYARSFRSSADTVSCRPPPAFFAIKTSGSFSWWIEDAGRYGLSGLGDARAKKGRKCDARKRRRSAALVAEKNSRSVSAAYSAPALWVDERKMPFAGEVA